MRFCRCVCVCVCAYDITGDSGECVCVRMFMCLCVVHYMFVCKQAWGGGHKIWRIITKKRLGRRWKASYWFLKGPDSSPECFISSALFVLHIKDSIFLWILIAVKTAHPLLAEGRTRALTVSRQKRDVGCMWPLQQAPTCQITKQKMTDMWRCMKMAQNKEKKSRKAVEAKTQVLTYSKLRISRSFCFYNSWRRTNSCDTGAHIYTRLGNEKSSVKTWIRIWWAHRERWNASACRIPAQCKQPALVCACLPPLKLLSISPWCPFLLIQTFVPPATTDAASPQDFIHKHSVWIIGQLPAQLRGHSCPHHHHVVKRSVCALGESHKKLH